MKKALLIAAAALLSLLVLTVLGLTWWYAEQTSPLRSAPQHGISFLLEFDPSAVATESDKPVADQLKHALLKRVNRFDTRMHWELAAPNLARVSLPLTALEDRDIARKMILRPGNLEFRLVHEQSAELLTREESVAGYEVLAETRPDGAGSVRTEKLIVKTIAEGQGRLRIKQAMATVNPISGKSEIMFEFDDTGAREFAAVTESNIGRQLAIVLDGTLYSAPRINEPISNGRVQISGNFTTQEAFALAAVLDSQLPTNFQVVEERGY